MPKLLPLLTPFQQHVQRWKDCSNCHLHHCRTNVVLSRGQVPCEVLFIAEAPGFSEDNHATAMIGPAGHLMDRIIADAEKASRPFTKAFTNLVACIPKGENGRKTEAPFPDEIKACRGRLIEFVRIAKPRLIVKVGNIAAKNLYGQAEFEPVDWLPDGQDFMHWSEVIHPSAIGQQNPVLQASLYKRSVLTISSAVELLDNPLPF